MSAPENFFNINKPKTFVPMEGDKLTDTQFRLIREDVWLNWAEHLEKKGVKEPGLHKKNGKYIQRMLVLFYLRNKIGQWVTKEELEKFVRLYIPTVGDIQDGRHLGRQEGWNIEQDGNGKYRFVNLTETHPSFSSKRRQNSIGDWDGLKKHWKNRCSLCGAEEGQPHWKPGYENIVVKLEMGHADPALPLTAENGIPQCQLCNKTVKNMFVFDSVSGLPKRCHIAQPISSHLHD